MLIYICEYVKIMLYEYVFISILILDSLPLKLIFGVFHYNRQATEIYMWSQLPYHKRFYGYQCVIFNMFREVISFSFLWTVHYSNISL